MMNRILALLMACLLLCGCMTAAALASEVPETEAAETAVEAEETAEEAEETAEEAEEASGETAEEPAGVVMYVGAQGGLKLRAAASLDAPVLMSVMVNRTVTVLGVEGSWAHVRFDWTEYETSVEGYMWAAYLSDKPVVVEPVSSCSHKFVYEYAGDCTHKGTCSKCGASKTGKCNIVSEICTICGQGFAT